MGQDPRSLWIWRLCNNSWEHATSSSSHLAVVACAWVDSGWRSSSSQKYGNRAWSHETQVQGQALSLPASRTSTCDISSISHLSSKLSVDLCLQQRSQPRACLVCTGPIEVRTMLPLITWPQGRGPRSHRKQQKVFNTLLLPSSHSVSKILSCLLTSFQELPIKSPTGRHSRGVGSLNQSLSTAYLCPWTSLLVPAECSQTPGRRWLWAVTQSCRIFYLSSSFESHQPFLSPEFPATQDVILTDRRFVKCVCTSFFSKLLASSEKSHVEPPNGCEDVGFLELCVGIVSPILTSSVIRQVWVLLCDSIFKSLR